MSLYPQIEKIVIGVVGAAREEKLRESADLIADGILDSYSLIEVVVRIEDELKFAIPDEQLTSEYFGTLSSLSALCEDLAAGSPKDRDTEQA